jgi:hypothetical protein
MLLPPRESIVTLRYVTDEPTEEYATGFFLDTREHGTVCVTAGHVFIPGHYRGPQNPQKILVNGRLAELKFNAYPEYGIDVALTTIPPDLPPEELYVHTAGISCRSGSAFYAHAWCGSKEDPNELQFTKIWGVRIKLDPSRDRNVNPRVARACVRWRLQSHVAKLPEPFDPQFFQAGWSGAPVFNVCSDFSHHQVIGVLSKNVGDRDAKAVSVESLDFLEPRTTGAEAHEIMPPLLNPKLQRAIEQANRESLSRYDLAREKFEEIMGEPVVLKITEPRSPYDREEAAAAIA